VLEKARHMLAKFKRYPLTFGPSPIEKLNRLSAHLGGGVEIYAKRDDCNSGLAFGGNKIRKLEYIVPDALAAGADTLVTIGGVQSNHTRQVAAVAAKLGMKCRAGAGKLGAFPGRRLRPRWQHPDEPRDGRRGGTGQRRFRHRHS
jgi:1-aminocyclopropane-1-carboxylate deaminase/D-cysteine desulfhydrase-like pyridoxal-dependent ACC family enzyme